MTIRTFLLPDLGEGLTEADIIRWLVDAGDTVAVDQPIVEVETAKSLVEVPSPFGGTVATLHAEAGTTLDVGRPLVSVEDGVAGGSEAAPAEGAQSYREEERAGVRPEAAAVSGQAPGAADTVRPAANAEEGEADDAGSGNVLIGYGTPGGAATGRTRRRKAAAASPVVASSTVASPAAGSPTEAPEPSRPAPRVVNPLVRRLAREHGVDLTTVRGTGPGGLILRTDVLARAGAGTAASVASASSASTETTGAEPTAAGEGSWAPEPTEELDPRTGLGVAGVEQVSGVRKVTAAAMARSRREIPEATIWVDVDVTPLLELRTSLKARGDQEVPGLLAFAARFALAGLARFPELAKRFEEDGAGGHRIVSFDGINLGFAVQTERGLVVPAIRGAHAMTARQLNAELRRMTELARSGRGTPRDLSGGTFTINNYGVFGTDGSAAIINHPEVAILGMGRIIDRAWVVDGELAVRKVMQLSLVFDHRICDGGTAGGFLRFVADCFENPVGVLADL
ncbi:dihydrolipoamide acetyltransferase family protein [Citricoccus sp. K5]|uniref:dihydrolipoamide acetyltransferase family protein n=1 Tax=Citricoccus sp. K5 TaxID=2653135 RepID=UPI0012EF2899|nr:dihydrolipoamide acetyltransferase family protein [Citricoccus sp. K5]VXA90721.1 Dihydrolipoamide acetyltransferase component of pyruvate dehydrogenase complex [Citricoccus sp. K5]